MHYFCAAVRCAAASKRDERFHLFSASDLDKVRCVFKEPPQCRILINSSRSLRKTLLCSRNTFYHTLMQAETSSVKICENQEFLCTAFFTKFLHMTGLDFTRRLKSVLVRRLHVASTCAENTEPSRERQGNYERNIASNFEPCPSQWFKG